MGKTKVIDNIDPVALRKIIPYGNSLAIPIPKSIINDLDLEEGQKLVVSIDRGLKVIILSKTHDLKHKDSDVSFQLKLPKEFMNKMLKG